MFQKVILYCGMLLLAGAGILATPNSSWAHGGGGGHGGGGHFGGAHFGGAHFGGYHGGFYHGGYHYGYGNGYHYPHYGYYHRFTPYYFYYPYYYNPGFYGAYGGETPPYTDDSTSVAPPTASYQSFYPDASSEPDTSAHISVNVPEGAQLWFEGKLTTVTGPIRYFDSPPLMPGSHYHYKVRASWNENGHEVTQTQEVKVTAGAHIHVYFPLPSRAAGQTPAVKKG